MGQDEIIILNTAEVIIYIKAHITLCVAYVAVPVNIDVLPPCPNDELVPNRTGLSQVESSHSSSRHDLEGLSVFDLVFPV